MIMGFILGFILGFMFCLLIILLIGFIFILKDKSFNIKNAKPNINNNLQDNKNEGYQVTDPNGNIVETGALLDDSNKDLADKDIDKIFNELGLNKKVDKKFKEDFKMVMEKQEKENIYNKG